MVCHAAARDEISAIMEGKEGRAIILSMALCRTVLYVHRRVLGIVLKVYTSSASRLSPRVALVDLCRDRPCKQPKGQPLFFLVYHGNPEMLPAVGAEELREMLEGTLV